MRQSKTASEGKPAIAPASGMLANFYKAAGDSLRLEILRRNLDLRNISLWFCLSLVSPLQIESQVKNALLDSLSAKDLHKMQPKKWQVYLKKA